MEDWWLLLCGWAPADEQRTGHRSESGVPAGLNVDELSPEVVQVQHLTNIQALALIPGKLTIYFHWDVAFQKTLLVVHFLAKTH